MHLQTPDDDMLHTPAPTTTAHSHRNPTTSRRRPTQQARHAAVTVVRYEHRGWGLQASSDINEREFVVAYTGEVLSSGALRLRRPEYDKHGLNYVLAVRETISSGSLTGRGLVLQLNIDGTRYGNESRFINHSCEPCLVLRMVRRASRIPEACFFAGRAIRAGEELTFDYGAMEMTEDRVGGGGGRGRDEGEHGDRDGDSGGGRGRAEEQAEVQLGSKPCFCGTEQCRGFLPYQPTG